MMLYFFKTFEGLGHGSGNKVLPHSCSALSTYLPLGRLSIQLGLPVLPTCVKPVRLAA
jgi:hypothetical protein